jgi:hypothetical protein
MELKAMAGDADLFNAMKRLEKQVCYFDTQTLFRVF